MPRSLPRKPRWRVLIVLATLLAVGWFVVPQMFVPAIQRKLEAMLSTQLKADLQIGTMRYAPPYGVRLRGVSLMADDPKHGRVELLKVGVLDLKLARLPFGKGPLVVENITITDPEVHVVVADGAVIGRGQVVRKPGEPKKTLDELLPPGTKLSDMFRLRHFGLHGGRVVFENRDKAGAPPMVWRGLDAEMQTAPRSESAYDFSLATGRQGPADLSSSGVFDLDELWVQVDKFRLAVSADAVGNQAALPTQVQSILDRYHVKGRVTLEAAGRVPLREPSLGGFGGALELSDASGALPEHLARVDRLAARITFAKEPSPLPAAGGPLPAPRPTVVKLERFTCDSGPARLTASLGAGAIDHEQKTWSMDGLRVDLALAASPAAPSAVASTRPSRFGPVGEVGTVSVRWSGGGKLGVPLSEGGIDVRGAALAIDADGLSVQPKRFDAPLHALRATVRKSPGSAEVLVSDAAGAYGNDRFTVTGARLAIPADPRQLADELRVDELAGTAEFRAPRPVPYPAGFGRVIDRLRPDGVFTIGGRSWYGVARYDLDPATTAPSADLTRRRADYFFSVSADDASFDLLDGRMPVTGVRGDATFSALSVDVERAQGKVYGGTVVCGFHVTPKQPRGFHGEASLAEIQLKAIGDAFDLPPNQREKLAGTGFVNAAFAGLFPVKGEGDGWLDSLRAEGQFEVFGGHFWTLPVLGHVAERVKQGGSVTVGEAAGRFEVKDRRVELRNAAVQSPALGLLGSGSIGFDKSLDLKVIAAPLGDWRDRLKRGGIPILSDVAAEVFGTVQKVLNAATSTLLYEFHVKGTLKEPKVDTIPAPVLTEPAALLLGQMVRDAEGKERSKWSATAKKKS